jgi:hypothetical protein
MHSVPRKKVFVGRPHFSDPRIAECSEEDPVRIEGEVDRATTHFVGTPVLGGWGVANACGFEQQVFS